MQECHTPLLHCQSRVRRIWQVWIPSKNLFPNISVNFVPFIRDSLLEAAKRDYQNPKMCTGLWRIKCYI